MSPSYSPILIDKPLGATPLQALDLLRRARPELANTKLSYAGRLDPMASGLLPVLHGDQLTHQEDFWSLKKEYQAVVALGLETDSYDVLGVVQASGEVEIDPEHIQQAAQSLVGKLYLSVPIFSSHRTHGKAMFSWARQGMPADVPVPVRQMAVSELVVKDIDTETFSELATRAQERIKLVQGDFRQEEIARAWQELSIAYGSRTATTVSVQVRCASGTYIRSLAHELGRKLGTGGVLIDLRRTVVGPWHLDDPTVVRFSPVELQASSEKSGESR